MKGGPFLVPPLCREMPASWIANVGFFFQQDSLLCMQTIYICIIYGTYIYEFCIQYRQKYCMYCMNIVLCIACILVFACINTCIEYINIASIVRICFLIIDKMHSSCVYSPFFALAGYEIILLFFNVKSRIFFAISHDHN